MRVAFLLPTLSPSGGTRVVVRHAAALRRDHGVDAAVVTLDGSARAGGVDSLGVEAMSFDRATESEWDVVVGAWWTAVLAMRRIPARRHLCLAQGEDEAFYGPDEPFDRLGAALGLLLADGVLAVSPYLAGTVGARRPGGWCRVIEVGLDKAPYAGLRRSARPDGSPLRVLVEGQPTLPVKQVAEAVGAARAATAAVHVTLAALDPGADTVPGVDAVASPSDPRAMAELYAASDVLVKLSRSEGLGLPPLEAAHVGTPVIATPYGGHAAWLEHGRNGILVGFDDPGAVADWLTLLAGDQALLDGLGQGAERTAAGWPEVAQAAGSWSRALQEACDAPLLPGAEHVATSVREHVALGRMRHASLVAEVDAQRLLLRQHEAELDRRWEMIEERDALIGELFESRDEAARLIEEITTSRAYRTAVAARRVVGRVRPGGSGGAGG